MWFLSLLTVRICGFLLLIFTDPLRAFWIGGLSLHLLLDLGGALGLVKVFSLRRLGTLVGILLLLYKLLLRLQILSLAFTIIIGQVTVLTEALRVVGLVRVRACPGLLGAPAAMVTTHAHILGVVASRHMWATHSKLLVILEVWLFMDKRNSRMANCLGIGIITTVRFWGTSHRKSRILLIDWKVLF